MNISPTPKIIAQKDGAVGRLIINTPEKRNSVSLDMWQAMPVILDEFERDPAIRVIVISGAGGKAFISGADISEFDQLRATPEQCAQYDAIGDIAEARMAQCCKPTIAHIRGYCVGGGMAMALHCDLRIAADDAHFGVPAARLGLGYGEAGIKKLIDVVGPACAKDILFTGRLFSASEALTAGLVNRVVVESELDELVDDYCQMIAANAPLTIQAVKGTMEELLRLDGKPDFERISALVQTCFDSDDYIEGRKAFMEKRKPDFTGH